MTRSEIDTLWQQAMEKAVKLALSEIKKKRAVVLPTLLKELEAQ